MNRKVALRGILVVLGLALAAVLAVHLIYWIGLLILWGLVFWPHWWAVLIVICGPLSHFPHSWVDWAAEKVYRLVRRRCRE